MLSLEGNSSPYLQYTYARAKSILRKGKGLKEANLVAGKEEEEKPKRRKKVAVPKKEQFSLFEAIDHLNNGGDLARDVLPDPENTDEKIASLLRALNQILRTHRHRSRRKQTKSTIKLSLRPSPKFNSFYNSVPVIKANKEDKFDHRIDIVTATAQTLKNGLALLQVEVLEEM